MTSVGRDDNNVTGLLVTGSSTGADVVVEGDESTKGINVQIVGDDVGIGGGTQYIEGATDATITGTAILAEGPSDTLTALQVDASSHLQVDIAADSVGIGGGTQYTEGDTDATITGNAIMMEVAADTLQPVQGTVAAGLLVNLGTNNDVTLATLPDTAASDLAAINTLLGTIDADTSTLAATDFMLGTDFSSVFGAASLVSATPAVKVEEQGTVTVSGTVTANAGTGNFNVNIQDGSGTDLTSTLVGADQSLDVNLTQSIALDVSAATVTVDLGANNDVTTELTTDDLDTGIGVDTRAVVGLVGSASGGGELIPGSATNGLLVNLGTNNDVTLATLPDTAAGDLAAINSAVSGTLTVGSHAVTNAGTFAVQEDGAALTALQLIDDPVAVLGTATYTEATTKGMIVGAVRNDTLTTLANTDNEIAPLQVNASGALYVDVADGGTLETLVDGIETLLATIDADTSTLAGAVSAGQMQVDIVADGAGLLTTSAFNAAFGTAGSADTQVLSVQGIAAMTPILVDATGQGDVPITLGGEAVDTELTTDDLDTGAGTDTRAVVGLVGSASGGGELIPGSATNGLLVNLGSNNDVSVTGTVTVDLGANNDVVQATHDNFNANANVQQGNVDVAAGNPLEVTLANGSVPSHAVTNAGTFAVQVDGNALTALQLIDNMIYVDDADWTADTSSHALVGAVSQATTTVNTDGDTTPLTTNTFRELRTAIPESDLATAGTSHVKKYYTAATPTDGIIWSPAAGKRWYITDIFIGVSAASTVTLEDDLTAGDSAVWKMELAANSGWSHSFNTPLYSGEDAADLIITASAGTVYVTVTGWEL